MWMTGYRKLGLLSLALVIVGATACTTVVMEAPAAAVGAQLSVERFLQASNQRDYAAMGNLFGTQHGAAMDTGSTLGCAFKKIGSWFGGTACTSRENVEIRMDAIASILQHQDYQILSELPVPGRSAPTTRVVVNLTTLQGATVPDLPFVVVQTAGNRWLIEEVDLQRVMAAR
jgi:hypothetical protein